MQQYRCPRTKQLMTTETCQGRKVRRHPGCVSCTYPNKVLRNLKRIEKIQIKRITDNTKARNPLIEMTGLAMKPVTITPRVAQAVMRMLQEALEA